MTPVVETSGLTKRYRRVTALRGCTISVPEGRISALVGPNGAGKTTLLRLLAGLTAPTSGRAAVLGGVPRYIRTRDAVPGPAALVPGRRLFTFAAGT